MGPGEAFVPSLREYSALYAITPERVRPGQVVMHPGPMNRGVEIDPRVADSVSALVSNQVRAGLVVRMAALYDLVAQRPVRDSGPREGARGTREVPPSPTAAQELV
jgi:aspartate carbamoyltransferase catalytic subunit